MKSSFVKPIGFCFVLISHDFLIDGSFVDKVLCWYFNNHWSARYCLFKFLQYWSQWLVLTFLSVKPKWKHFFSSPSWKYSRWPVAWYNNTMDGNRLQRQSLGSIDMFRHNCLFYASPESNATPWNRSVRLSSLSLAFSNSMSLK
jgi:hypothetical protein